MKIAYITVRLPYGAGENFIGPEVQSIIDKDHKVFIFPLRPEQTEFFCSDNKFEKISPKFLIFSWRYLLYLIRQLFSRPLVFCSVIKDIFLYSGSLNKSVKNLYVFPKACFLSQYFIVNNISHIHAHWGGTTSSLAFIVSRFSDIPWSFTLHRWDIYENNLLLLKSKLASFVRVISLKGRNDFLQIINAYDLNDKIHVIPMGVQVPHVNMYLRKRRPNNKKWKVLVPANYLPVKGHTYLFDAVAILREQGFSNINVDCYGVGWLKDTLIQYVENLHLDKMVFVYDRISHDLLLSMYESNDVDIVVLPSVNFEGEHEGVPVSLMEAMSYGVPVVSTRTGSIPELVVCNSGLLVNEKNAKELAAAIKSIILNENLRNELSKHAYLTVNSNFNLLNISRQLTSNFGCQLK